MEIPEGMAIVVGIGAGTLLGALAFAWINWRRRARLKRETGHNRPY